MKSFLVLLVFAAAQAGAGAHPVPDLPVRTTFAADGTTTVRLEVDPRCFAKDPLNEPYLENSVFQTYTEKQKNSLKMQAAKLIEQSVRFALLPDQKIEPAFELRFTTFDNKRLEWNAALPAANSEQCAKEPVVITAECRIDASEARGYRIASTETAKFSVLFLTWLNGVEQRVHVLFPGEKSYVLDLAKWRKEVEGAKPADASE